MAGVAHRLQARLLEEARGQTMPHAPAREFQRRTVDRRMWVRGGVFFGKVSTEG